MAILVEKVRGKRCVAADGSGSAPSIREVCLVGVAPSARNWGENRDWSRGSHVTFSGRVYRVEAEQVRSGGSDAPRYLHVHLSGRDDQEPGREPGGT